MDLGEINSLYFNNVEVDFDFRWLLNQLFNEDEVFNFIGQEINLIPLDIDGNTEVEMPAVTLTVEQSGFINKDDTEIQRYTPFLVEINVYTSGTDRVKNNNYLCNKIICYLQSNGVLPHYYCRGLRLDENREVNSIIESAYRRVLRFSGLCDNKQKLIK